MSRLIFYCSPLKQEDFSKPLLCIKCGNDKLLGGFDALARAVIHCSKCGASYLAEEFSKTFQFTGKMPLTMIFAGDMSIFKAKVDSTVAIEQLHQNSRLSKGVK